MEKLKDIIKYTKNLKLLFIEDDIEGRKTALLLLEEFFDNIIVAKDGQEGFELFQNNIVDLIITDINMPRLNGLDMIEKIRKENSNISIVIFSAYYEPEYFTRSIYANIQGYLIKPVKLDQLLDVFEKIITKSKLDKAEERLKEQNQYLYHQAHHDSLTALPNRILFKKELEESIVEAHKRGEKLAILFIDLDKFKTINDTIGHQAGDMVLIEMSKRMQKCIRKDDMLARISGDEFTAIIKNFINIEDAIHPVEKILDVLRKPIVYNNHTINISGSIGVSIYPDDTTQISTLLQYADKAMYKAKDNGRNCFEFYNRRYN